MTLITKDLTVSRAADRKTMCTIMRDICDKPGIEISELDYPNLRETGLKLKTSSGLELRITFDGDSALQCNGVWILTWYLDRQSQCAKLSDTLRVAVKEVAVKEQASIMCSPHAFKCRIIAYSFNALCRKVSKGLAVILAEEAYEKG